MNKRTRQNVATALKNCLQYLDHGNHDPYRTEYICEALGRVGTTGATRAQQIIMRRLENYSSVRSWLASKGGISPRQFTHKRIQQHRVAWVKKLIKEFSK